MSTFLTNKIFLKIKIRFSSITIEQSSSITKTHIVFYLSLQGLKSILFSIVF